MKVQGVRNHTSQPVVPTPTVGTQAANKDYADTKATDAASLSLIKAQYGGMTVPFGALDRFRGSQYPRVCILSTAAMTASALNITVGVSYANFSRAGVKEIIQIDNEQMLVTAGQGTTSLTVTRAINGTTLAAHSLGASITTSGVKNVVLLGDSIAVGVVGNGDPFFRRVQRWLGDREGGLLGYGYVPMANGGAVLHEKPYWTINGVEGVDYTTVSKTGGLPIYGTTGMTGFDYDFAPFGALFDFVADTANGATLTFPPNEIVRQIDVHWIDVTTALSGRWSYSLNGGVSWLNNPNPATNTASAHKKSIILVDNPDSFMVRAAMADGTPSPVKFMGADLWSQVETFGVTKGVKVHNLAYGANYLRNFTRTTAGDWGRLLDGGPASLLPSLVISGTFSNDMHGSSANWTTSLDTLFPRLAPYASVLAVNVFERGDVWITGANIYGVDQAKQIDCRDRLKASASTAKVAVLDLYDAYSAHGFTGYTLAAAEGLHEDFVHPSAKGQRTIAAMLTKLIGAF